MCADQTRNARPENPDNKIPSWADAPLGWDWLAQDEDGRWFWYGVEPRPGFGVWRSPRRKQTFAAQGSPNPDWLYTCQKRPGMSDAAPD